MDDVERLEVILHLQKTRYMPLNVIKQRLEGADDLHMLAYEVGLLSDVPMKAQPKETKQKLHPLEDIPDLLGVSISFVRSLAQNDLVRIVKSPKNRELIDGNDFEIIRFCDELSRFHIEPRNLRQYVVSANRESTMFEQVLVGMLGMDDSDEDRSAKLERAFKKLHDLTDGLHTALLKNRVFESLNAVVKDADVDSIDDELARAEAARSAHKAEVAQREAAAQANARQASDQKPTRSKAASAPAAKRRTNR